MSEAVGPEFLKFQLKLVTLAGRAGPSLGLMLKWDSSGGRWYVPGCYAS